MRWRLLSHMFVGPRAWRRFLVVNRGKGRLDGSRTGSCWSKVFCAVSSCSTKSSEKGQCVIMCPVVPKQSADWASGSGAHISTEVCLREAQQQQFENDFSVEFMNPSYSSWVSKPTEANIALKFWNASSKVSVFLAWTRPKESVVFLYLTVSGGHWCLQYGMCGAPLW